MIQVMPGGLCHAHGPYEDSINCPEWPTCAEAKQVRFYVQAGKWFTTYEERLRTQKDKVVEATRDFLANGDKALRNLIWEVNELGKLEMMNEMYEKMAGWSHKK